MSDKKLWKNKHQKRNKHTAMYPCNKFQLIWKTSDLGPNLPKKCE